MTAFLFDEGHSEMDTIFGPQCASFIIKGIEENHEFPTMRIFQGSLLHDRYCYKTTEIVLRSSEENGSLISSNSSSQHLKPDMDHFRTVICDLAETTSKSGSSMTENEIRSALAHKNIWVVVAQGLPENCLVRIVKLLSSFRPFLGWIKVDRSNEIHLDLFEKSLLGNIIIDKNGIYKSTEWEDETGNKESEVDLLKEYGSKYEPIILNHAQFSQIAPKLFTENIPSERSLLSVQRVAGEAPGHRAKVGKALLHEYDAVGGFRRFSTSRPEDGIEFNVPDAKLTEYVLNLDHPKGGPKARFFRDVLGIVKDDWRYLADQICQAAAKSEFYRLEVTGHGVMHGAQILITGRNKRQAVIETGWKLGEVGPAQLVTAYAGDQSKMGGLEPFLGRVPEMSCPTPDRWRKIHEMAHSCGMQRGEKKVPNPMILEKWGTIWEGICGFGWVSLPDARTPFARWALKEGIGYATRPGVHISSKLQSQSVERNFSYAIGYAEVLRANGIECRAEKRLD